MNNAIDFVITWVDGNDIEWIKEKNKYSKGIKEDYGINNARFRNWDNLKYLFRSIEEYAPWVNKIHFVTCGHLPEWLNKDNKKLNIVNHKDFIPQKYLPTFSANPIELNLHRIPGISENFVFFNDDMFIVNKVKEEDFFVNNLPIDSAILNIHCPKKSLIIHNIALNDVALINEHFNPRDVLKKNTTKWFNLKYGFINNVKNLILSVCPRFPGFKHFHMSNSYLKSTYQEVWEKEFDVLDETCSNKFRTRNDVNQWLMRVWQLVDNKFVVSKKYKQGFMIDFEKMDTEFALKKAEQVIMHSKYKLICINDGDTIENFEYLKDNVNKIWEKKFPNKSSYEK